jgi:hypothetical protein
MAQTFKVIRGVDMVKSDNWFQMVDQAGMATRSTDDPLNVRRNAARLEIRKNFFSGRVTERWNKIPSHVKNVKTVSGFQFSKEVTKKESCCWLFFPRGKKVERWRDGAQHEEDTPREVPAVLLGVHHQESSVADP